MPSQQQIDAFTLAFHRVAVARLQEQPGLVVQAVQTLDRWRDQRGSSASEAYFDEWRLMLGGDLQALQRRVCKGNDEAATLRNVSPLGFVLTPAERQSLRVQGGLV